MYEEDVQLLIGRSPDGGLMEHRRRVQSRQSRRSQMSNQSSDQHNGTLVVYDPETARQSL